MAGTSWPSLLTYRKPSSRDKQVGFTLLELLIVIFIISLISAGFVKLMVGFGGATLSLENETKRLHRILSLTAQEAILQGSEIGLQVEVDGYYFVARGQKYWVVFDGDEMLQHHSLPQDWRLQLMQDDEVVPPVTMATGEGAAGKKKEQPAPSILFYPSGEADPFQLRIYAADNPNPTLIEAKENGEVTMRFQEPEE